jgi:hypothetical protein
MPTVLRPLVMLFGALIFSSASASAKDSGVSYRTGALEGSHSETTSSPVTMLTYSPPSADEPSKGYGAGSFESQFQPKAFQPPKREFNGVGLDHQYRTVGMKGPVF